MRVSCSTHQLVNWLKYIYIYIYISLLLNRDGSSVMFPLGSPSGFGSCNIRTPSPNDPFGIDLTPTSIPAAKLRVFHTRKMTAEIVLFMGITFKFWQQPIRAWLLWWLLRISFKIEKPLCSATMTSLFGYLFNPICTYISTSWVRGNLSRFHLSVLSVWNWPKWVGQTTIYWIKNPHDQIKFV